MLQPPEHMYTGKKNYAKESKNNHHKKKKRKQKSNAALSLNIFFLFPCGEWISKSAQLSEEHSIFIERTSALHE